MSEPNPSPGAMRILGGLAVGVLALAIAGILAVSAGLFDPFPADLGVEPLVPGPLRPGAGERVLRAEATLPAAGDADARLTASADGGAAAYGLWLGSTERHLAAAVSSEGYVAVWLYDGEGDAMLLGWQPWPHVRPGAAPNEIRLERQGDRIGVWINREWLWEGEVPALGDQVGTVAAAPGAAPGAVEVRIVSLKIGVD